MKKKISERKVSHFECNDGDNITGYCFRVWRWQGVFSLIDNQRQLSNTHRHAHTHTHIHTQSAAEQCIMQYLFWLPVSCYCWQIFGAAIGEISLSVIIIPALSDASFLRWIIAAAGGDVCDSRVSALATKAGCSRHHQGNIRMCQEVWGCTR